MVYGLNDIKTWPLLQILSEILRADWSVAVICEGADQLRSQVLSLPPEERRPYNDIMVANSFFFFIFFFSVSRARFLEKRRPEMDVGNCQGWNGK